MHAHNTFSVHGARSAAPHWVALFLHTSGTTSRPKMVPLIHPNLWHAAQAVRHNLELLPRDRA